MIDVEQLIREMFMLNSYFIIFILRKNNDVSLVCLILDFKISNAKTIKNEIALF